MATEDQNLPQSITKPRPPTNLETITNVELLRYEDDLSRIEYNLMSYLGVIQQYWEAVMAVLNSRRPQLEEQLAKITELSRRLYNAQKESIEVSPPRPPFCLTMINLRILSETRRRRFWSWFGEGGKGRKVVINKSSYTTISSFWPEIVFEPCPCPSYTTSNFPIRAAFLGFKRVGNTSRSIDWELCRVT